MAETAAERLSNLHAPTGRMKFTYARGGRSWFRRKLISSVELASGSRHLERLYDDWVASGAQGNPFEAAIRLLEFQIELAGTPLASIPKEGGVLLVANHPFGVADGLALGWLATQLRSDVRILTHASLCRVPEFEPYLLPVDFAETPDARRRTAAMRRKATDALEAGAAVVIFPGGSVATSNRPFSRPAAELPWHPFVARLALTDGASIVPVFFHGQNSFLFQMASHVSYALRVAMLFGETRRRIGGVISMTVGTSIEPRDLAALPRSDVARALRRICLVLGDADPEETFFWPSHITW
ncbi:MAG: 1-acyl-sn-glycerol-3-phosphate acyltransferase [Roseicyclus sp.]